MKKLGVLIIVMSLSMGLFSQGLVRDNNGDVWVKYTTQQKITYVIGWFSAMDTMRMLTDYLMDGLASEVVSNPTTKAVNTDVANFLENLADWGYYDQTVGQVVESLDAFYAKASNRQYKIYVVILYLFDKDWWN